MGIRPMDLPVIPPSDVENIHHVERKSEAHDSEHRPPAGREDGRPHSVPEEATEDAIGEPEVAVHDSVEISAQYQTEQRASRDGITPPPPPEARSEPPVTVERHLDIQA